MYLYGFNYVLYDGGMTLTLYGQGHNIRISQIIKMTYFGKITEFRSPSI